MCIYCGTNKYRQIYKKHHGPIPKDEDGRSYEIHHIDGNHSNNDPNNLKCVTIKEHYDIHYSQEDYGACWLIARHMKLSPREISELASKVNIKRVENGTHPFLGGEVSRAINKKRTETGEISELARKNAKARVLSGTHHFLGPKHNEKLLKNGTHKFLDKQWQKEKAKQQVLNGTHNLLGKSEWKRKNTLNMIEKGIHCSQVKKKCEHCNKILDSANYGRYHGDKCSAFTGVKHVTKPHKRRERIQCEVCLKIVDSSNFKKYNHGLKCEQLPK